MLDNDITIIVNTCDKYEEAWSPFFQLFIKYWPNCPYKFIVNTEVKKCHVDGLDITTHNSNEKSWGRRLAETLETVTTPYVLCFLEDFFIRRPVKVDEINKCLSYMKSDPTVAVFYYNMITGYRDNSVYEKYYEMKCNEDNKGLYMLNCQAALWRRDVLHDVCLNVDDPWMFEVDGYNLAYEIIKEKRFYCLKNSHHDKVRDTDVFSYLLERETGYGIYASKWLWNNKKWLKKEGITCGEWTLPIMSRFEFYKKEFVHWMDIRWNIKL